MSVNNIITTLTTLKAVTVSRRQVKCVQFGSKNDGRIRRIVET